MKAVVVEQYESIEKSRIREVNDPAVSEGQLRVKVQAVASVLLMV